MNARRVRIRLLKRRSQVALGYAKRGWPVLPLWGVSNGKCECRRENCPNPGKHPCGRLVPNGVKGASTEPGVLRAWWDQYWFANVGIATGSVAGLVVLDVDVRNGGDESLRALEQAHGKLPDTAVVRTGGGGHHYYLGHPGGHLPCSHGGLGKGLDLQTDGVYVVAPPSDHASGNDYAWLPGRSPDTIPIAPLPEWLARLVSNRQPIRPSSAPRLPISDSNKRGTNPTVQDNRIRFLQNLALQVTGTCGAELICSCPFCDKERHLYVNAEKILYDCKRCGEQGNYFMLLDQLCRMSAEEMPDERLQHLAVDRGLPVEAFEGYGFGWTGAFYTLPVYRPDGKLANVFRYWPGGKLYSAPGGSQALFRGGLLIEAERQAEPVYLTEGAWDAIALEWVRRRAKAPGVVVGVPGAGTFKDEWVKHFRGRDIVLFYDNDQPGAEGEAKVAGTLSGVGRSLRFFKWNPTDDEGMDLRDLIKDSQE